jgi:hypothetical protein
MPWAMPGVFFHASRQLFQRVQDPFRGSALSFPCGKRN